MKRILFEGDRIFNDSLVIGNHSDVHLIIHGDFMIRGLVHCPQQKLKISIRGNGELSLHGVCKQVEIVRSQGQSIIDFSELKVSELRCLSVGPKSLLRIAEVRYFSNAPLNQVIRVSKSKARALTNAVPSSNRLSELPVAMTA